MSTADHLIKLALQNGWMVYGSSLANLQGLVQGYTPTFLNSIRGQLVAGLVKESWVTAWSWGPPPVVPLVAVELAGEAPSERPLGGGAVYADDGTIKDGLLSDATVRITMGARNPDQTRVMYEAFLGILSLARTALLEEPVGGLLGVEFEGAGELALEELLMAESHGIFVRRQDWQVTIQREFTPVAGQPGAPSDPRSWFILTYDNETDAGHAGGVKPIGA